MVCWSWWYQIFETDGRNVKRRTECFSEKFLHVCEEERWYVSLQKFINEPSESRQLIVSFVRRRSTIEPFSIMSPLLLRQIEP